jgi:hypothetical protein
MARKHEALELQVSPRRYIVYCPTCLYESDRRYTKRLIGVACAAHNYHAERLDRMTR